MRRQLEIGWLSGMLARPWLVALLVAQAALVLALSAHYRGLETSEGCLYCHADKVRMEEDGYPQFFMTREQVERESKMPGVTCRDCHLGDGRSRVADEAHDGMLKMLVIDTEADIVKRKGIIDSVLPSGGNRMYALFPKTDFDGESYPNPEVFTILWHDRDPDTLGYDRAIAEKTCGKKGCHELEVEQFDRTVMGGNVRQRSTRHWMDEHGPNNCGPSFADLPPDSGGTSGYSRENYEIIRENLSCPSSYEDATDRQRFCNVCHSGCMDCHYNPNPETGAHSFTGRVPSANCSGGGRGTGVCHAGTMERRRGDTYLGGDFSQPSGMEPDPHVKAGLECIDCHETGERGMGDIQRRVDCSGCHYFATRAHEEGVHRKMRCQACHVGRLGGYQMTAWGRGEVRGRYGPFKKYSLYYGIMENPMLIKDYEGLYTPYKVWPNSASNFRGSLPKREGISFRWPGGETRDAYAFLGTYDSLPEANNALAWLQLEAVGHPLGKSRSCGSCHDSTAQDARAWWEYLSYSGSEPFTGEQRVVADEDGLRVVDIRRTSDMELIGDADVWDFAAWLYLGDIWNVKGDFSIPKSDQNKYRKYQEEERAFKERLAPLDARLKSLDPEGDTYKSMYRKLGKLRGIGVHDPGAGLVQINAEGL